jgi:hypothetical protein
MTSLSPDDIDLTAKYGGSFFSSLNRTANIEYVNIIVTIIMSKLRYIEYLLIRTGAKTVIISYIEKRYYLF